MFIKRRDVNRQADGGGQPTSATGSDQYAGRRLGSTRRTSAGSASSGVRKYCVLRLETAPVQTGASGYGMPASADAPAANSRPAVSRSSTAHDEKVSSAPSGAAGASERSDTSAAQSV